MQDSGAEEALTGFEMAAVFREFDDLWELPVTPQRRARMEFLMKLLEPEQASTVADISAQRQR